MELTKDKPPMNSTILVTGGCGYIGSHTVLSLLEKGCDVIILDNLKNSHPEVINRIEKLGGKRPDFIEGDIRDKSLLDKIFSSHSISSVVHFAGLKAVGESHIKPLHYYENNVVGSLNLLRAMEQAGVFKLVFSSSATVYGEPLELPINEAHPTSNPASPYGRSKLMVEEILQDLASSDDNWKIAILRYFNPIGAHASGLIGENPNGVPNNLLPYISQVAIGKLKELSIFGNDYPTKDGTGIRDYIHVCDLAEGHSKALDALESTTGVSIWNLGTGNGYSVLEIVQAFEAACGINIPYIIRTRRPGDIAACWADPSKASDELGWKAKLMLSDMMKDTWRWQSLNPNGFLELPQKIPSEILLN